MTPARQNSTAGASRGRGAAGLLCTLRCSVRYCACYWTVIFNGFVASTASFGR